MTGVHLVVGTKAESGKTLFAVALVDYYRALGRPVIVIETDTTQPDVDDVYARQQSERLVIRSYSLASAAGWHELVEFVTRYRCGYEVVVNTGAGNHAEIETGVREGCVAALVAGGQFVSWWLMTPDDETLESLHWYLRTMPAHTTHVVLNAGAGDDHVFPAMVPGTGGAPTATSYIEEVLLKSAMPDAEWVGTLLSIVRGRAVWMPCLARDVTRVMRNRHLDLAGAAEAVVDETAKTSLKEWNEAVHASIGCALGAEREEAGYSGDGPEPLDESFRSVRVQFQRPFLDKCKALGLPPPILRTAASIDILHALVVGLEDLEKNQSLLGDDPARDRVPKIVRIVRIKLARSARDLLELLGSDAHKVLGGRLHYVLCHDREASYNPERDLAETALALAQQLSPGWDPYAEANRLIDEEPDHTGL